jgi:hypothetical protein
LFEATRPLYERRFLFFRRYDLSAQVWDLAVIVGGLEIRSPSLITFAREGWTFLRTGRLAHPEAFFEIIDDPQDPNSPYSPYYLGFNAFQDVGFKKNIPGWRQSSAPFYEGFWYLTISMVDLGSKSLFLENNQSHRITVCMWKALLPLRISWNFMLSTPVAHCRI